MGRTLADYSRPLRKALAGAFAALAYGPFLFYLAFKWIEVLLDPEGD